MPETEGEDRSPEFRVVHRRMATDYEADFYSWSKRQAELARQRSGNAFDWDNVAAELDALSRSEYRELRSRYAILLAHLLKWLLQPERRGRSWANTIAVQRLAIAEHLHDNPGLRPREAEAFARAFEEARRVASTELDRDLDLIPEEPPFSLEQARAEDWLPDYSGA